MQKKVFSRSPSLPRKFIIGGVAGLLSTAINCSSSSNDGGSSTKIVGGRIEYGRPEVLRTAVLPKSSAGTQLCTAVAISDSVLLLAAHCVAKDTPDDGLIVEKNTQNKSVISTQIYTYDALRGEQWLDPKSVSHDIAAAVFPKGSFSPPYAKLAKKRSSVGDKVTIVGFGGASYENLSLNRPDSQKRSGENKLAAVKDGALFLYRDLAATDLEHNAAAAPGDSGGPVYNSNGELIGIISALFFRNDSGIVPISVARDGKIHQLPVRKSTHAGNAIVDLQSDAAQAVIEAGLRKSGKGLKQNAISLAEVTSKKQERYLSIFFWLPFQMLSQGAGAVSQAAGNVANSMQGAAQSLFSFPSQILSGLFGGGGSGGSTGASPFGGSLFGNGAGGDIGTGDTGTGDTGTGDTGTGDTGTGDTGTGDTGTGDTGTGDTGTGDTGTGDTGTNGPSPSPSPSPSPG